MSATTHPVYIVLLGPPGVGKGTQASILKELLHLAHISSGDLFRDNIKGETDLGIMAQSYMARGELVPDDITISMIRDRLKLPDCANGAILDGFPRTPAQAEALEQMLAEFGRCVDAVLYITGDREEMAERVANRVTCAKGHIHSLRDEGINFPGTCPLDNTPLSQRPDDNPKTAIIRFEVYQEQTLPLVQYYLEKLKLLTFNGLLEIEAVTINIMDAIKPMFEPLPVLTQIAVSS